ncbi:MAG: hypothetical protein CSA62_12765 [Planctomycetota bacterium]|nr:MAG: hypothetical protein CSA62_12765 [Planctomycetota bacterium]
MRHFLFVALLALAAQSSLIAQDRVEQLLRPLLEAKHQTGLELFLRKHGKQEARLRLLVQGEQSFTLDLEAKFASFRMVRKAESLRLDLRHVATRLLATGSPPPEHSLQPKGFGQRLFGSKHFLLAGSYQLLRMRVASAKKQSDDELSVRETKLGLLLKSKAKGGFIDGINELELRPLKRLPKHDFQPKTTRELPRDEFENSLARALYRFVRIYIPAMRESSRIRERQVPGGALIKHEGQRLVLLRGTPEELGRAHGQLLAPLLTRTIDSYVHLVGAVQTLTSGKYFLAELREAWRRLSPHIPDRHQREITALAKAAGVDAKELRLANVLPEYFHCSGFAVFGPATKGGVLYHGRILDYMTTIGLQDVAVTFYVEPAEGHAFVHVGYAGFIGVVTGMNEKQLALGEMGGGGRYEWDGVPMATLMRRTLEECRSLSELRQLWKSVPRTCEYYYVASSSNGKDRKALAIWANSQAIKFLEPGCAHPKLGEGIPGCVYLSAGSRLENLRKRILANHGNIDQEAAIRLMDRPVAMKSNLHNALMVPETGEIFVAHAKGHRPAASQAYARFALDELRAKASKLTTTPRSIRIDEEGQIPAPHQEKTKSARARSAWVPRSFTALWQEGKKHGPHILSFPSPKPLGITRNDRVTLEWFPARGADAASAPAMLCLHILDGRMLVARGIARSAAIEGIHGFVLHMPGYGNRGHDARSAIRLFEPRTWQCVADIRRARILISKLPGVDPDCIWLQGTSLGGMVAALSAAAESQFRGHFLLLAGGGLENMLKHGKHDTAKIRQRFASAGIQGKDLVSILQSVDPARYGHDVEASKTWMFNARDDHVVPPANTRTLAAAIRIPKEHLHWFPGTHYTAAIFLPTVLRKIWGIVHEAD